MSTFPFSSTKLDPRLLDNLDSLGYANMTQVQAESLPLILGGRDLIAQARTGSGKTAAFGLGLLHHLRVEDYCVQALVLCPTRELADQVAREIRRLARTVANVKVLTLCGGVPFGPQLGSLEHGAHIIVGTPGRVEEHLRKGSLEVAGLRCFVLDEADRMLEMGFQPALEAIVKKLPRQRQTLLFSATFPEQIQQLSAHIMKDAARVQVESLHSNEVIEQRFYSVDGGAERLEALAVLLLHLRPDSAVVFCNTRRETEEVATALLERGFVALALHGELEQKVREQILTRFANKSASVLVATDVAARGLDIDSLDVVFNYHLARDPEVHIHRIGRTGRGGQRGIACTLLGSRDQQKIARLQEEFGIAVAPQALPRVAAHVTPYAPAMACLQIDGGRKQKLRPGDIVGALTGKGEIDSADIGKIHVFDQCAYVAVKRAVAGDALHTLSAGKLKGRNFRARRIRG